MLPRRFTLSTIAAVAVLLLPLTPATAVPITARTGISATAASAATAATYPSAGAAAGTVTGRVLGRVTCAANGAPFADIKASDQHCDSITWLAGAAITQVADGRFRPAAGVSRAAMTAFLYRLANPNQPDPSCTGKPFRDVAATHRFCGTIAWAKKTGVTTGKADGRFAPADTVRRDEMAIFLARIVGNTTTGTCPGKPFRDVAATTIACAPIQWMADTGISTGYSDGTFRPAARVSRAAMAAFLQRLVAETGAAPGITTDIVGPLAGATVIAYPSAAATDGANTAATIYPRTLTDRGGTFTLTVPAGSYRICVDGSTITSRTTYGDSCAGGTTWPSFTPSAPAETPLTTVGRNGTVTAPTTTMSVATQNRRATADPAPVSTSYRLIDFGTGGQTPRYSACRPIHYVISGNNAPPNGTELIEQAIARVSQASGLRFIHDGATTEPLTDRRRTVYQPARYGEDWAPVLIGWSNDIDNPRLTGDVVGFAGSQFEYGTSPADSALIPALVTGTVVLDAVDLSAIMNRFGTVGVDLTRAVIMHELAHLLGLDHVDDEDQLLYPYAGAVTDFGDGDLAGLFRVGQGPCVTLPEPAATTWYVRIDSAPGEWLRN